MTSLSWMVTPIWKPIAAKTSIWFFSLPWPSHSRRDVCALPVPLPWILLWVLHLLPVPMPAEDPVASQSPCCTPSAKPRLHPPSWQIPGSSCPTPRRGSCTRAGQPLSPWQLASHHRHLPRTSTGPRWSCPYRLFATSLCSSAPFSAFGQHKNSFLRNI